MSLGYGWCTTSGLRPGASTLGYGNGWRSGFKTCASNEEAFNRRMREYAAETTREKGGAEKP